MTDLIDLEVTPCLLVNHDQVERNCKKMHERCEKLGVHLRPNMKTVKTLESGLIATGGTKQRISVSTLREAEVYSNDGYEDILFTTPLMSSKIPRAKRLNEKLDIFHTTLDSLLGVKLLEENMCADSKPWSVFIKVDMGAMRAGILWSDIELLMAVTDAIIASSNITLHGLYFYDGHSYDVQSDMISFINTQQTNASNIATLVKGRGVEKLELSYGSTPSCSQSTVPSDMTEYHPGAYVFNDCEQASLGACTVEEIAVKVATRVVGHYPKKGQILIDCGFMGLGLDGIKIENGKVDRYECLFKGHEELRITSLDQEIGKVKAKDGSELDFSKYPVGSILYIYPYHCCCTASCYQDYTVINDQGEIVGKWKTIKGW